MLKTVLVIHHNIHYINNFLPYYAYASSEESGALIRLSVCPGSSELSMFAHKTDQDKFVLLVGMCFKYFFGTSCPKKIPILARYQSIFYTN